MDFSSCVGSQLRYLVGSLTKQNFNASVTELDRLLATFGVEATRFLLGALLQEVQAANLLDAPHRDNPKLRVLNLLLSRLPKDPNFISVASEAFDANQAAGGSGGRCDFLTHLCRALNLPLVVQLTIGLGLAHSNDPANQLEGVQFLKSKLGELTANVVKTLPDTVLLHLLHFVSTTATFLESERTLLNLEHLRQAGLSLHSLGASAKEITTSNRRREVEMAKLAEDVGESLSLAGVMREMGSAATASKQVFGALLEQFPALTALQIAQAVGLLAMRHGGPANGDGPEVAQAFVSSLGAMRPDQPQPAVQLPPAAPPQPWSAEVFVSCLQPRYAVDWREVVRRLDFPGFEVPNQRSVALILTLYKKATGEPMPVDPVLGRWANSAGQVSLLQHLPSAPPDLVDWSCRPRAVRLANLDGLPRSMFHPTWSLLDFIETLLHLAERGHQPQVRKVFEAPCKSCPDTLLISLLQASGPPGGAGAGAAAVARPPLQRELALPLLRDLTAGPPPGRVSNTVLVLAHLMATAARPLAAALTTLVEEGLVTLPVVMKLAADQKWLHSLLDLSPSPQFVADLALTAAGAKMLGLAEWLGTVLAGRKPLAVKGSIARCLLRAAEAGLRAEEEEAGLASPEPAFPKDSTDGVFAAIFDAGKVFRIPNAVHDQAKALLKELKAAKPLKPPSPASPTSDGFPSDIEDRANDYFQQVYKGSLAVDEMLALLNRFKSSADQKEVDVYNCTIHNLFDEYRFFPKYPEKEIQITAELFGGIISRNLIANNALRLALKYVLQAIARPVTPKMEQFGLIALDRFKHRLPEASPPWPQYCTQLKGIEALEQHLPGIDKYLDGSAPESPPAPGSTTASAPSPAFPQTRPGPTSSAGFGKLAGDQQATSTAAPQGSGVLAAQPSPPLPTEGSGFFGTAGNLETLLGLVGRGLEGMPELAERVQQLLGSLNDATVDNTAGELKRALRRDDYKYFADYLVIKRTSLEPAGHKLHIALLERVGERDLEALVLQTTYYCAKALIASDRIKSSPAERSLLKNVGAWLGHMTIARNKPVLTRDMDLKEALFESLGAGKMIAVVPFVAKVLEQSSQSKVFRPPNPWLMGLLTLLVEIHQLPDLKVTLKFEVEVLLKNISVEMAELQQLIAQRKDKTTQRRLEALRSEVELTGSTDFMLKEAIQRPGDRDREPNSNSSSNSFAHFGATTSPAAGLLSFTSPGPEVTSPPSILGPPRNPFPSAPLSLPPSTPVAPTPPTLPALTPTSPNTGSFSSAFSALPPFSPQFSDSSFGPAAPHFGPFGHPPLAQGAPGVLGPGPGSVPPPPVPEPPPSEDMPLQHPFLLTALKLSATVLAMPALQGKSEVTVWAAVAVDRAVTEISQPCVERSVMIACTTTRELVMKDFATDSNDGKLRQCAAAMVQSLASNLAMVTCKDPLRQTMATHLRSAYLAKWGEPQVSSESGSGDPLQQVCETIAQDNLELGVALVRRSALDEATREIAASLEPAMDERRKARESSQPYVPRSAGGNNPGALQFIATLPDALRPKQHGVAGMHHQTYEEFAATIPPPPDFLPAAPTAAAAAALAPTSSPAAAPPAATPADPSAAAAALQSLHTTLGEIEKEARSHYRSHQPNNMNSILSLTHSNFTQTPQSPEHERIKELVCGIHPLIREDTALLFAQDICEQVFALSDKISAEQRLSPMPPPIDLYVLMLVNEVCLFVLQTARERSTAAVTTELTRLFLQHPKRWQHKYVAVNFIRLKLINMQEFDQKLTDALQAPASPAARQIVEFAGVVVQRCLVDEQLITQKDLKCTLECLGRIAKTVPGGADGVAEGRDGPGGPAGGPNNLLTQSAADPALRQTVARLFAEWIAICNGKGEATAQPMEQQALEFIGKLQHHGMLKAVHVMDKFFGLLMEMSVESCVQELQKLEKEKEGPGGQRDAEGDKDHDRGAGAPPTVPSPPHYQQVDAFSDLIVLLIKCCGRGNQPRPGDASSSSSIVAEVALLTKVVAVVSRVLLEDHDVQLSALVSGNTAALPWQGFHQQPYFRFFSNLLIALNQVQGEDQISSEILTVFSNTLHYLSPTRVPGFGFSWLELVSHRMLMPKLLLTKQQDGWPHCLRLLTSALKFLEPSLRTTQLSEAVRMFYKGTLKVLLVLLHDFPEFLCNYHYTFCDAIPAPCIQMRNVVLSSFPRHMRLPDPFTPNLKVDLLPEITQPPRILSKFLDALKPGVSPPVAKDDIDGYLRQREPLSWVQGLHKALLLAPTAAAAAGCQYDLPVLNALVLYVGMSAIAQLQGGAAEVPQAPASIVDSAAMDVFRELITRLDSEGRYYLLNALVNHLRYPNSHTHYFSCVVLHLFAEARGPHERLIQEQITRVLLERLIVNRPHPWGLLITFIELVKNPRYEFWKKPFIRCTPEIERLFDNVGQSCVGSVPSKSAPAPEAPAAPAPGPTAAATPNPKPPAPATAAATNAPPTAPAATAGSGSTGQRRAAPKSRGNP